MHNSRLTLVHGLVLEPRLIPGHSGRRIEGWWSRRMKSPFSKKLLKHYSNDGGEGRKTQFDPRLRADVGLDRDSLWWRRWLFWNETLHIWLKQARRWSDLVAICSTRLGRNKKRWGKLYKEKNSASRTSAPVIWLFWGPTARNQSRAAQSEGDIWPWWITCTRLPPSPFNPLLLPWIVHVEIKGCHEIKNLKPGGSSKIPTCRYSS